MSLRGLLGIPLLALIVVTAACRADVDDEGSLPEVEVEGGELPTIDIDPADVNIDVGRDTVVVPEVDIDVQRDTTL